MICPNWLFTVQMTRHKETSESEVGCVILKKTKKKKTLFYTSPTLCQELLPMLARSNHPTLGQQLMPMLASSNYSTLSQHGCQWWHVPIIQRLATNQMYIGSTPVANADHWELVAQLWTNRVMFTGLWLASMLCSAGSGIYTCMPIIQGQYVKAREELAPTWLK